MGKKRILLGVTDSQSIRLMDGLPEFLSETGWEVLVVASWKDGNPPSSDKPGLAYSHIRMTRSPNVVLDFASFFDWLACIYKYKPDVIFVGTPKASLLGLFAAKLLKIKTRIYHVRGLRFEGFHGITRTIFLGIERFTIYLSTTSLCVSRSVIQVLRETLKTNTNKFEIIGNGSSNGVRIEDFTIPENLDTQMLRVQYGLPAGTPVVGFMGRISKDKGISDLVKAHQNLLDLNIAHTLLIVGSGEDQEILQMLKNLAQDDPHIKVFNHSTDPSSIIRMMDVLCLPTYREGFPNVVLEASASSIPVITTNATGAIDSVINGSTGIIYPKGDVNLLTIALSRLISSPEEMKRLGSNGRLFVEQFFKRDQFWKQLNDFLKNR